MPDPDDIGHTRATGTDDGPSRLRAFWRRWKRWIIAGVVAGILVAVAVPIARVWIAWSRIERVDFDPSSARVVMSEQLLAAEGTPDTSTTEPDAAPGDDPQPSTTTTTTVPLPENVPFDGEIDDEDHNAILIIGSDAGGFRADVIMLALIPANGSDLTLVSLPRDLYLDDPCGGGRERINAALNGCGDVSGPNLLAIVVEDFTGVPVDHFVLFDFDGFARVIDAAGGVEVCVDHPTFDTKTDPELQLPTGCSTLEGAMALSWVRSRHTQEMVDGSVRSVPGVDDLTRNERQRDVVLQLLDRLSDFPNPAELVRLVEAVPDAFTLDQDLSLGAAISLAWDLRGTPASSVDTPEIPVTYYQTDTGALVLLPAESFAETMGWRP